MCAVLQAVKEAFVFVVGAEAAATIEGGIVIVLGQLFQVSFQFSVACLDFRRIIFVALSVGSVELI